MHKAFIKRIQLVSLVTAIVFAVVLLRLFLLQIYDYGTYKARAMRQQGAEGTGEVRRGEIFMQKRGERISVASTQDGWLLAVNPQKVADAEALYKGLAGILPLSLSHDEFIKRASKKNDPHEVIEHHIAPEVRRAIEERELVGIEFLSERWRVYPAGNFASHVLGFVDADGKGAYGVERVYDDTLTYASESALSFFTNTKDVSEGEALILTLDSGVQTKAEELARSAQKTYSAKSAGVLVMNPKTGKIIAMAAVPSYDPNSYSKVKDVRVFSNPFVENLFEMGSVVKPLTMAAAIDAGAVNTDTAYVDTGERNIDDAVIKNFDGKARGKVNIQEILSQSLNVGAVFLMEQLGKGRFRDYMRAYAIGEPTGIDLPSEAVGNLENLKSPRTLEYATAAFGQGISMTALELVRALSSIANGGFLVNLYVVEDGARQDGAVKRILKEETAKTVTRMLVKVVDEKLAGGKGKIPGYAVAAKTGTAQIALSDAKGYSDEFLHTFFGYGPAFDPQFMVFMFLERPHGIRYASESLTQPFREMIQFLFSYFEVLPDSPQELSS
ncbi:MAG: penicillin-binding protein 2 [Candidatus Ryanbacteria bacterium]|nr:penicillin-binding protein 2 [Candidatus Ryanbacteria bacterium]